MAIDFVALGTRIKYFRGKQGLSQEELCKALTVNSRHISNIETGKKAPSIDLLVEIANALDVSADDLLTDSLKSSASTADTEIHHLLLDCNKTEEMILTDMIKHLKAVLIRQGI